MNTIVLANGKIIQFEITEDGIFKCNLIPSIYNDVCPYTGSPTPFGCNDHAFYKVIMWLAAQ